MLRRITLLWEIIGMGIKSIFSNKMRSALTTVGVFIGVATIISMVSVIEGMNNSFKQSIENMGSSLIFVFKFEPGVRLGRMPAKLRNRKPLKVEDADVIDKLPSIQAASPFLTYIPDKKITYRGEVIREAIVRGTNYKFPKIWSINIADGRYFTDSEVRAGVKVCLIGYKIVETLFPNINPIGKKILIGNRRYTVIGMLEQEENSIFGGEGFNNNIFIPYTTLMKYYPYKDWVYLLAKPKTPELKDTAIDEITEILRIRRKVKPNEDNNFSVFTQETYGKIYKQITGAAFFVMILISGISLLVGGIGVMNIMIVTVKERTREIGIRKAIGAKNKDILWQFLIEAITLTITGGIAGLLFGWLFSIIIKSSTSLPATMNLWSVIMGFSMAVFTGLFFGIFPAMKAAKLPPIEALRYE
jgi:putative ABC transport system permease protein